MGKLVRQDSKAVANFFCEKKYKKYYQQRDGKKYQFHSLKQIILPYEDAKKFVLHHNKQAMFKDLEPTTMERKPPTQFVPRRPVIAVMGHINHGKTTLLDTIRKSSVAENEVAGITQKINVCEVDIVPNQMVTFLDTPGHFHFFRMRTSAACVADLVVLLVSVQEGTLLQTEEAIGALEDVNLPVVVAVNKMDLAPERLPLVISQLQNFTALDGAPMIPIVATDVSTLDTLKETIHAFLSKANPQAHTDAMQTDGIALEVHKVHGRGNALRVLIQNGKASLGDHFVCGLNSGCIRSMLNMEGEVIESSIPGQVVDIFYANRSGVKDAPLEAPFYILQKEHAEELIEQRYDREEILFLQKNEIE